MEILHILKSPADDIVNVLMQIVSNRDGTTVLEIFREDVDWLQVVDEIFAREMVICWW
jgi:hypothetical protein